MRKLFLFFCCILYSQLYSQKTYVFNVELSDKNLAPTFAQRGDIVAYTGTNQAESAFFAKYTIHSFNPTYPNYSGYLLNVFTFVTSSKDLMNDLKAKFPEKYLNTEDLSDMKQELADYYPDDYGNGVNYNNPVPNLGANLSMKALDYIGCPKAWEFFPDNTPKGNVTIGFSDSKVHATDLDFAGKVTYLHENSFFHPIFDCTLDGSHGTGTSAIAAAQGDNHHGITGVCYDCNILSSPYTFNPYNSFMEMAQAGVRVINISWVSGYYHNPTYSEGFVQSQQDAIDQLHGMGVVLVASAGNNPTPGVWRYAYPASYNHVISVSVVHAKNHQITDEVNFPGTSFGWHSHFNEDIICETGGIGFDLNNPVFVPFNEWAVTTNARVDICGPGYQPNYPVFLLGCNAAQYNNTTSGSAPFVSGTVGLMQSLNPCLIPDEVEDVLQLTSKNLEIKPENVAFIGAIGSGKLETGDAVEFTHEMMNPNGVVLVEGQDFWRFDFNLKHIFNGMEISNQRFRDANTTNFIAKNFIDLTENVDLIPTTGFIDLKIDSGLVVCSLDSKMAGNPSMKGNNLPQPGKAAMLYPNPNKGVFSIVLNQNEVKDVVVTIFDVIGKPVYETKVNQNEFELDVSAFPAGMYLVKLSSGAINETLKFIKE